MQNAVSFVGYVLAFLIALIVAARWISRHHPGLRDADADRLARGTAHPAAHAGLNPPPSRNFPAPPRTYRRAAFCCTMPRQSPVARQQKKKGTRMATSNKLPAWTIWSPLAAWAAFGLGLMLPGQGWLVAVMAAALAGAVFSAVHHAEVVALQGGRAVRHAGAGDCRNGDRGVALIVSVMLSAGPEKAGLARDTVFAAVMIICNGIVGVCLFVGGLHHREQEFQAPGAKAAMAVLVALLVLTMVLPNFTSSTPGPMMTSSQLAFSGLMSLVLYGCFVFVQTVRHRDYFLVESSDENEHAPPPPGRVAAVSGVLLVVCLVAVVALAKMLSPSVEAAVAAARACRPPWWAW